MAILLVLILSFVLAVLGKSLVGFSLVVPFILTVSFQSSAEQSFLFAFMSGLAVSFVDGSPVGRASLALLLASGLVHLYGRRFSSRHWAFTLVFAGLGSLVYSFASGRQVSVVGIGIDAGLVGLSLPLAAFLRERFFPDSIRIKV